MRNVIPVLAVIPAMMAGLSAGETALLVLFTFVFITVVPERFW